VKIRQPKKPIFVKDWKPEKEREIEKINSAKDQATQNLQHMHPKLPTACFHERECSILVPVWHHLYNPLHCGHLDHDSLERKTPHPPPQREKERGFLLFSLPSPLWQLPERLSPAQR
jgi:hypothetical protein